MAQLHQISPLYLELLCLHLILSHFHPPYSSSVSWMLSALPLTNANQCFSCLSPLILPPEDHRMIIAGKHSFY